MFPVFFLWKRTVSYENVLFPSGSMNKVAALHIWYIFLVIMGIWLDSSHAGEVVTESKDESSGRHHFTPQIGTTRPCEHFRRFTCQMMVLSAFSFPHFILDQVFHQQLFSCENSWGSFYTLADKAVHVISGANSGKACSACHQWICLCFSYAITDDY